MISFQVLSQHKVSGRVLDDKKQVVAYANVLILNAKDSSYVKGVIADLEGEFSVQGLDNNAYWLKITALGFKEIFKKIEVKENDLDLKDILLEQDTKTLKEVTVTARKPLVERHGDKMIVNIESQPYYDRFEWSRTFG